MILLIAIIVSCNHGDTGSLTTVKKINYPSASGVEYVNGKLFIIGDDANNLLILDSALNVIDSISLYNYREKRIPKDVKADLEAIASYRDSGVIFLFGSGSLPTRNTGWRYYLSTNIKDSFSLIPLYTAIKKTGIEEINIEGACFVNGMLVIANRGNKGYPKNHLLFTEDKFWEDSVAVKIHSANVTHKRDSSWFSGISGLTYYPQYDWLIATVSSENTSSAVEDGAIGKSYLWIFEKIFSMKDQDEISPDIVIDLEAIDHRFKNQKIESVSVVAENEKFISLVLVADNDDGSSAIFKLNLEKEY